MENIDFKMEDLDLSFEDLDLSFDLEDAEVSKKKNINRDDFIIKPKIHHPVKNVKYSNAEKMANEITKNILNGDRINCILSGSFIFGDFLEAFMVKSNLLAEEIVISTLSLNEDNIDSMANILKGKYCKELSVIVSDYFYAHNKDKMKYIFEALQYENIKVNIATAGVHTKIILIKTKDLKIIISGSANLRSSQSLEFMQIESDDEIFDFYYEWHRSILVEYEIRKKSIRGYKLWQVVAPELVKLKD